MYERMVVAIDHSPATGRVLTAARDLARLSQGQVWVVHVREHQGAGRGGVMASETIDEAHRAVDAAVAELAEAGVRAQPDIRYALTGHAASEISDSARAHDAGVIVMGSRGRSDLAGVLLGSTAHKVIHLTDRPVLVVR